LDRSAGLLLGATWVADSETMFEVTLTVIIRTSEQL
jgi:hypothetical protein